jgi:hypothetical protein
VFGQAVEAVRGNDEGADHVCVRGVDERHVRLHSITESRVSGREERRVVTKPAE